ncbi:Pectinacetylesterase family protein [Heracleum sosnowskyi]|uniref:Pectinacetylesterase family protein n=1 Tax=Heracleum sosnowskyi TaxID=360622 RepID=A0AAD8GUA1_9APIA|nr:Pectinacetylesterase family protein [Heracleum sosnowskyi]
MASWELDDDRMNFQLDDVDDQGPFDPYHHQDNSQVHGLSRLATCTTSNSTLDCENFEPEDDNHGLKTMLSRLSIESIDFGGDADEEFSDSPGQEDKNCLSSEYENEKRLVSAPVGCFSLPGTPLGHKRHQGLFGNVKHYTSENETRKLSKSDRRRRWKRRVMKRENIKVDDEENISSWRSHGNSLSGESENGGLRVITRPKGGEHSLCMDMEEVKACRDLGFELELDTKIMPSRLTISPPLLDTGGGATTSSGGSSPISNWRISSPGDDPKDVKARLKVWAQAVAIASTSPRSGCSC